MKHSKGEWELRDDGGGWSVVTDNRIICSNNIDEELNFYDGQLIASAPNLLEACKAALDHLTNNSERNNVLKLLSDAVIKTEDI